ncbi:MAG: Lrp/AsnC family transcriptional regulator [Candidatus Puniceispirillaceae bacterium]
MLSQNDHKIINLLKRNARMSVTQMSHELGLSRVTIDNHMKKLEEQDVIRGYTVVLGSEDFKHRISGWVLINAEANREEAAIEKIKKMPEFTRLHTTNGKWDLVAEIQTNTLEEFDAAISRLRKIAGITETETSLLLSSRIGL